MSLRIAEGAIHSNMILCACGKTAHIYHSFLFSKMSKQILTVMAH